MTEQEIEIELSKEQSKGSCSCDKFLMKLPMIGFIRGLYKKYDATFLTMLGMQYFNQGTKILVHLASSDLFKAYYKLEPSNVQSILALIALPWSIKILYGLISDNFPICGSRRKSYLLLAALLQFLSMVMLTLNSTSDLNLAVACLFMSNLSVAFADVIVDSLMVI